MEVFYRGCFGKVKKIKKSTTLDLYGLEDGNKFPIVVKKEGDVEFCMADNINIKSQVFTTKREAMRNSLIILVNKDYVVGINILIGNEVVKYLEARPIKRG